jgi:arylsulfate sulfotransferase
MKTFVLAALAAGLASAAIPVRLTTSLPSPQPVGAVIGLVPRIQPVGPAPALMPGPPVRSGPLYTFRYMVSVNGGPFRMVRDFSQEPTFFWSPDLYEHEARIRMTVRLAKETSDAEIPFAIVPRAKSAALITPTSHPLVALFSAPPCSEGAQFRVAFRPRGQEVSMRTPDEPCHASITNNVYVAGMRADSDYEMRAEVIRSGKQEPGAWMNFHTGLLDGRFAPVATETPREKGKISSEGIIIRSTIEPWRVNATDLDGNTVWYLKSPSSPFLTRTVRGGHFLAHADGPNSVNDMKRWQLLQELDLMGNTVRETNIGRIAEQLADRGIKSDCKKGSEQCLAGFHHEAVRLPNGHTLTLAGLERMFPAGTQGSKEAVDILGDLILDLDENLQLTWFWNSFDHMDLKRASLGDEKCPGGPGGDGCTPVFLSSTANGWLHSNALNYDKRSGDLLVSIPEQDWVIKVDYKDGKGSGKILWRLGKDGDFTVKSNDPYPWFSYQHDVGFDPKTGLLVVFDDGHRRKDKDPKANNRGQTWKLDQEARTATLVMNADLGVYAVAVGSAQPLSDGNYSFESGFINPGPAMFATVYSRTTETTPDGKIAYAQQLDGQLTYRSFRVATMYDAPRK